MSDAARLLIVDDEPDSSANLADLFSEFGYLVDVAHSGHAALTLLRLHAYDAALLDFKMPGMSGLELYHELRRISGSTAAIMVTAYASRETVETMLAAGAAYVLPKPVDFVRLHQLVEESVSRARA